MKRRTMLKVAGGAGLAGSSIVGGYLAVADRSTCNSGESGHKWCYGVEGTLDTVSQGTVFVRERTAGETGSAGGLFESGPTADGEIVALDAESGEVRWAYGEAVGMDSYTDLAVSDGVYFGYCTDQMGDCRDLTALELDGEERWTRDINPGPYGPLVADGVVCVVEYSGLARALDAETGETRWERDIGGRGSSLSYVGDSAIYVETNNETRDTFVSLNQDDGSVRWRYEPAEDQTITGANVANGIAFVLTFDQVAAVDQGDELWRREVEEIEGQPVIEGIVSGRLFLLTERERPGGGRRVFRLEAINLATGTCDWISESLEHPNLEYRPQVAVHEEMVYVGTDQLRAFNAATGDERWSASLDNGSIQSVSVVRESVSGDYAVFVHGAGSTLASFAPDGMETWTGSVSGEIRDYQAGEFVFVETDEGIYALDRQGSP